MKNITKIVSKQSDISTEDLIKEVLQKKDEKTALNDEHIKLNAKSYRSQAIMPITYGKIDEYNAVRKSGIFDVSHMG